MAQHDYIIENAPGAALRADLNSVLQAIITNNSGATEPVTKYPNMWWYDTSAGLLKRRNNANDAWITVGLEAADTDGTLAANSDSKIATQKATKTYADTKVIAPASTTENKIPQWDSTSKKLKDGLTVGTGASNIVQLDTSSKLPPVDGSQLTNLPTTGFGAWVDKTADYGAQQATTDGFVCAILTGSGNQTKSNAKGYTDANADPSTVRGQCSVWWFDSTVLYQSFMMPVKKNNYWKVVKTGFDGLSVYWIPLGS